MRGVIALGILTALVVEFALWLAHPTVTIVPLAGSAKPVRFAAYMGKLILTTHHFACAKNVILALAVINFAQDGQMLDVKMVYADVASMAGEGRFVRDLVAQEQMSWIARDMVLATVQLISVTVTQAMRGLVARISLVLVCETTDNFS